MPKGGPRPNSGRKPGSPNKKTAELQRKIAAEGITPLEYMLQVLRSKNSNKLEKLDAAKAAAPYLHPRLSSVDMSTKGDTTLRVISDRPMTEDEWEREISLAAATRPAVIPS